MLYFSVCLDEISKPRILPSKIKLEADVQDFIFMTPKSITPLMAGRDATTVAKNISIMSRTRY